MRRPALAFLFFAVAAQAGVDPVQKSPETYQAEVEVEVIRARLDLESAKRRQVQLDNFLEMQSLTAQQNLRKAKAEAAGSVEEAEKTKLILAEALSKAKASVAVADKTRQQADFEAETKLALAAQSVELAKISSVGEIAQLQKKVGDLALNQKIGYPRDPMVDGVLHISDRRIAFNGVVDDALATFVCGRIAFYNALDAQAPIFIVIDRSPGGSVMSGYQILQAMESSKAPVYVVVKGYAASMAAIITTMAERSFVYPQTIVLHHQASTNLQGNATELAEQLKWVKVWCERIFVKVSQKMDLTVDEFVKRMYGAVSTGDWKVLGTEAQRLKWVTDVTDRMSEDSVNTIAVAPELAELKREGMGDRPSSTVRQTILPTPNPFDVWWVYDPSTEFILPSNL
jgi:ATP-dependent Clp protease protease subunit